MEYRFSNIGPGIYTYGVAPFTGLPLPFTVAPFVHHQRNNEGKPFLASRSTTGFEIVDRGTGPAPVMTITVITED